jgi:hypothetical protein
VVCSAADYFVSYSCTSHNVQNRDHDVFVTFVDDAGVSTSTSRVSVNETLGNIAQVRMESSGDYWSLVSLHISL